MKVCKGSQSPGKESKTPQWGSLSINEESMCQRWNLPPRVRSQLQFCSERGKKTFDDAQGHKSRQTWGWAQRGLGEKMLLTMRNSSPSETKQCCLEDTGKVTSGGNLTQHSKTGTSHQIRHTGGAGIAPWKRKGYSQSLFVISSQHMACAQVIQ